MQNLLGVPTVSGTSGKPTSGRGLWLEGTWPPWTEVSKDKQGQVIQKAETAFATYRMSAKLLPQQAEFCGEQFRIPRVSGLF